MMRVARIAFLLLFVSNIFFIGYVGDQLVHKRPEKPTGDFVVPYNAHGTIVYISEWDRIKYYGAFGFGFLLLIAGGVLYFARRDREPR